MDPQITWQQAMKGLITDPDELAKLLHLSADEILQLEKAHALFPLRIPRALIPEIIRDGRTHPWWKQMFPTAEELLDIANYSKDPLKETDANLLPGLLQKYVGRVLVTITSACAIHCRYCFRRHFPYHENNGGKAGWQKIYQYIQSDVAINEVILSGGDPLTANDHLLMNFCSGLKDIQHVKTLRFHTRVPIVLPERMTDALMAFLQELKQRFHIVFVLHVNHARELNDTAKQAIQKLADINICLLNQSVLLRGVNDTVAILADLSEALFALGILPYYLHLLDKVAGTAHFDVPRDEALSLHKSLQASLPGYLVPRLVYESPGAPSKLAV